MSMGVLVTPRREGGFSFRRGDGERFFLVMKDDGSAVLYAGADENTPPQTGLVSLDVNVPNKLNEAKRWVLAYPDQPLERG